MTAILIDTNVILDVLLERPDFVVASARVREGCLLAVGEVIDYSGVMLRPHCKFLVV